MKIIHVVGARPNFMKIAPIFEAISTYNLRRDVRRKIAQKLVHTGQHYDHSMSQLFFDQLEMPRPDINLGIGSGSHGEQTGRIMEAFEPVLIREKPDLVLVVGDVNSTMACAIDAKKLCIPVAHVEAGLRSRDMTMPEEINRIVTDSISDLLFTTDRNADNNLIDEGIQKDKIHFVGNVMIDTLMKHRERALKMSTLDEMGLKNGKDTVDYALVTLHRPGNVDDPGVLESIGEALRELGKSMKIVFPVHPRTKAAINQHRLEQLYREDQGILLLEPIGYLDFLNLEANARLILTDSGGIQEESTILGVPCLTLRPNTERPITIEQGTNRLVSTEKESIVEAAKSAVISRDEKPRVPDLWDGHAAERIVDIVARTT